MIKCFVITSCNPVLTSNDPVSSRSYRYSLLLPILIVDVLHAKLIPLYVLLYRIRQVCRIVKQKSDKAEYNITFSHQWSYIYNIFMCLIWSLSFLYQWSVSIDLLFRPIISKVQIKTVKTSTQKLCHRPISVKKGKTQDQNGTYFPLVNQITSPS